MILTAKNIEKWKTLLSKKMKKRYGIDDYAETCSDKTWIEDYEGYTEEHVIDDEIQYWDE